MLYTCCGGVCHCYLLAGTWRKCSWHVSWVGVGVTPDLCLVCGKCWGWRSPIGHLKLRDVQLVAVSQETDSTTQTRGGAGMSSCVHKSLFLGFRGTWLSSLPCYAAFSRIRKDRNRGVWVGRVALLLYHEVGCRTPVRLMTLNSSRYLCLS